MKTTSLLISLLFLFTGKLIAQSSLDQVGTFVLVDAATEQDVMIIPDGTVISLSSLENTKLNIRLNTSGAEGSVKFELSGTQSKTYTDNSAPYALHGDNSKGNYFYGNWNPPAIGTYTLKATPYSGSKATGTAGTPTTITFSFTEQGQEQPQDPPATQYSLTVNTVGSGSVIKSPNEASYASGTTVSLAASPASGYQFSGWSGDASGTSNPLSITMNSNKAITANFSPTTTTTQQQVTGFVLVNSSTEQDIQPITNGAVLNLNSLPSTKLNIRANTSPASVGSVKLELTGTQTKTYTDNAAPYALHGDDGSGNYYYGNWNPPVTGTYTLKATPYSGSKATGTAGTPLTISFTFTDQEQPPTDQTAPYVSSVNRQSPTTSVTSSFSVTYRATFSEQVTGVDASDFTATTVAGSVSGAVSTVVAVGTTGTTYDITVSSISGEGDLRLDLKASGTGIVDVAGNAINGGYASGQIYTVQAQDQIPPSVVSINRHNPTAEYTSATSVTFRASFSESVTGVDKYDFVPTVTQGSLTASISSVVTGASGTTYDITVSPISGSGTLRLDLKSSSTGITDVAGNPVNGGYTSGQSYTIQPATTSEGFVSVTKLNSFPIHTNLGDQPQSKVWTYDGKWWAVMPETGTGTHIWRLDGTSWSKALTISGSAYTKADCKVSGNISHIFLYRGSSLPSELHSVEYDPSSGNYRLWSQRASKSTIQLDAGVKTATIDIDGTGRMWLVSNGNNNVYARWSDSPYTTWSSPVTVATGLKADDISAVIYIPALRKTGILWSNQNTKRFGFRTHADGAAPTTWSADEVPASQSAIESGDGMADDHLNMAVASDGTLYCAIKTGYRDTNPRIALLVRRPAGTWDDLYKVSEAGNRPIVILNEAIGKLKVIYAAPNAGGIFYKESPTSGISFGSELSLINETCDYATSSKDNYSKDIVIFASTSSQSFSVLASDVLSAQTSASLMTSLKELDSKKEVIAYPNPFDSKTTISFTLPEDGAYSIVLYDTKGSKVGLLKEGKATAGSLNEVELDGSALPGGLYLVRVLTPTKTQTLKLMLKR